MQASSSLSSRLGDTYAEISGKMSEDFMAKLKFEDLREKGISKFEALDEKGNDLEEEKEELEEEDEEGEEEEEEDEEFSFACTNLDGSPISADDVFQDGQIRTIYPIFNQDLVFAEDGSSSLRRPLKKVFMEERDVPSEELPEGTYCTWNGKRAVDASPEVCKKSNSTGFSKLWRFRDLALRSNSDGKDAFVFLNPSSTTSTKEKKGEKTDGEVKVKGAKTSTGDGEAKKVKVKKVKGQTASSAQEKLYARYRAKKEGDKRKSYLPYRQDLVGFFTSVNGLSKNVHPF